MKKKTKSSVTNLCGKRVKLARVTKEMNQLELATALNVDFGIEMNQFSISQLERGSRFVKDFELVALAEILDVSTNWLLFGEKAKFQLDKKNI